LLNSIALRQVAVKRPSVVARSEVVAPNPPGQQQYAKIIMSQHRGVSSGAGTKQRYQPSQQLQNQQQQPQQHFLHGANNNGAMMMSDSSSSSCCPRSCFECYNPSNEMLEYDYGYDDSSPAKKRQPYPRIRERGEYYVDSYNDQPWSWSFGTNEIVSFVLFVCYIKNP